MANLTISRENLQVIAPAVRNVANELSEALEQCIEVARRFDGKVINKRFTDALQECSPMASHSDGRKFPKFRFSMEHPYRITDSEKWEGLEVYFSESIRVGQSSYSKPGDYLQDTSRFWKQDEAGKIKYCCMGERMDAEMFARAIRSMQYYLDRDASRYEDMLKNYSKYQKALDKAQEAVNKYLLAIPSRMRPQHMDVDCSVYLNSYKLEREAEEQKILEAAV